MLGAARQLVIEWQLVIEGVTGKSASWQRRLESTPNTVNELRAFLGSAHAWKNPVTQKK